MRRLIVAVLVGAGLFFFVTAPTEATDTKTLSGNVVLQSLSIGAGETVEFDPNRSTTVEVAGNVSVSGTLRMRPANAGVTHILRFTGVDEQRYVGGGTVVLETDPGLWIVGDGKLDAEGTPRAGWNRTGTDPSWRAGDELVVAPSAPGDFKVRPFTGNLQGVRAPDGTVYWPEVANLTRNVRIEGTAAGRAHVIVVSSQPQTIKWVSIRWMGPRKELTGDKFSDPVPGRTGLHFHLREEASRGSLIEGVVLRDIGGETALDIHRSNGVTVKDTVIVGANGDGAGWRLTKTDPSNDTLFVHDLVMDLSPIGRDVRMAAFLLGTGDGNRVVNSAAAAVRGGKDSSGFHWPEGSTGATWEADGLVSHNNAADGIFVWQNSANQENDVSDVVAYNNGGAGIDHGAYSNAYRYIDPMLFGNAKCGLVLHAKSKQPPVRPLTITGGYVGPVCMPTHNKPEPYPAVISSTTVSTLTIDEQTTKEAGATDFVDTGLQRSGVKIVSIHPGTRYRVQNGTDAWQVTSKGITSIPPFR